MLAEKIIKYDAYEINRIENVIGIYFHRRVIPNPS